jgi:hypothetical protein
VEPLGAASKASATQKPRSKAAPPPGLTTGAEIDPAHAAIGAATPPPARPGNGNSRISSSSSSHTSGNARERPAEGAGATKTPRPSAVPAPPQTTAGLAAIVDLGDSSSGRAWRDLPLSLYEANSSPYSLCKTATPVSTPTKIKTAP